MKQVSGRKFSLFVWLITMLTVILNVGTFLASEDMPGEPWAWGYNGDGELGSGTYDNQSYPLKMIGLGDINSLAAGIFVSIAVRADGTVWLCGGNAIDTSYQFPDLSDPSGYLTGVITAAAGESHIVMLKSDGTVWHAGSNYAGGEGPDTNGAVQVPEFSDPTGYLTGVKAIAASGWYSVALKFDGTVWAWGYDTFAADQILDPNDPSGYLTNVIAIAAGYEWAYRYVGYGLALKPDGTVWYWEDWYWEEDGPTPATQFPPLNIGYDPEPGFEFLTDVTAIAANRDRVVAVKSDGTVWETFPWDVYGQLFLQVQDPDSVLTDLKTIVPGAKYTLALKSDGTVWSWGNNSYGQLGDGTNTYRQTPVQVINPDDPSGYLTGVTTIAAGYEHSLAVVAELFNTPVSTVPITVIDDSTGTSITFQQITSPGNTTVLTSQTNPVGSLDPNFKVKGDFFDISTTATYSGNIDICIDYSSLGVSDPTKLKLLHWESADGINYEWVDVTTSIDELNSTICGSVSSLSWFVLAEVNNLPLANAGENIAIKTEEQSITIITGIAEDQDLNDVLQYCWKEGEIVLLDWTPVDQNGNCPLELNSVAMEIGTHTLTLEVSDGQDISSDDMILTIENSSPHAAPGGSGVYDINTEVTLGGQVSDFDGDLLNYQWSEDSNVLYSGNIQTIVGGTPVVLQDFVISSLSLGQHIITLQVSDGINEPQAKEILVEIVDNTVPTLAPIADKAILWPPNHHMVNVVIQANASDNSGLPVTLTVSVTSNEPIEGLGDGDMSPDWTEPIVDQENGIITLQLRAERSGTGNGRVYTITVTASDQSGNNSTVNIEIIVPHDKKK